jgi:hypothetical protein
MSKKLNRFYTYAYLRKDRTPYYIGKGSGRRIFVNQGKSCKKPKDKSRIIFLKQNLTEEEAFKHEVYMIALYGRKDLGTGILRNRTDGGEGASGLQIVKGERSGRKSPSAKTWRITFDDGRVEIVKSLRTWAIENNYNPSSVRNLYNGNCVKNHKDIIKVEFYDKNNNLVSFNRDENLDLRNKNNREYYQNNIEALRNYNNEWARKNKDKIYNDKVKEQKRQYREKNKERIREYQREYKKKYRENNRDKLNEYQRQWHKNKNGKKS